jgi:hypothetical protein
MAQHFALRVMLSQPMCHILQLAIQTQEQHTVLNRMLMLHLPCLLQDGTAISLLQAIRLIIAILRRHLQCKHGPLRAKVSQASFSAMNTRTHGKTHTLET